jgi:hypothetical protein
MKKWSRPFRDVLNEELDGFGESEAKSTADDPVIQRAHDARLAGIAFSGGGIRSATFNLGVLQALADLKLLRKFHYLSTVSGGGYIGSWLIAWIHRRGGRLDEVIDSLRTSWSKELGGHAPEEVRFLRRFSNYLTPKLGWLGADTWTVIATYLRNVLLNMATLIAAIAFVLMLPRVLGIILALPLAPASWQLFLAATLFVVLLLIGGWGIGSNLIFLQRRQTDIWSGEVLDPKDPGVVTLIPPAHSPISGPCDQIRLPRQQPILRDFILELDFKNTKPTGRMSLLLRVTPDQDGPVRGWAINLGDGAKSSLGAQKANLTEADFRPVGTEKSNQLRVACIGQTCDVKLNGQVVRAARRDPTAPQSGFIAFEQTAGETGIEVTQLLVRPLPDSPRRSRQSAVQLLVVVPFFIVGLILTRGLGQSLPLSQLLEVRRPWLAFLLDHQWALWAAIAVAIPMITHAFELVAWWRKKPRSEGKGLRPKLGRVFLALVVELLASRRKELRSQRRRLRPKSKFVAWLWRRWWRQSKRLRRKLWRVFVSVSAAAIAGATGGLFFQQSHQALGRFDNFWPHLIWGPPAFIVSVLIVLTLYVGLRGSHLFDELREWWSRLGAWLLIYVLLWVGFFLVALYSPPLLHWLALHLQSALAALGLGWIATTVSGLVASTSAKTGKPDSSAWREGVAAIAPYVFILGLLAGLAWGINGIVSPSSPARISPLHSPTAERVDLKLEEPERSVDVKISPHPVSPPPLQEILEAHWRAMSATPPERFLWVVLGSLVAAGILGWRIDINAFSMHMMYRNRLARCYLGASNAGLRRPHAFTGFDQNDDLRLADFALANWKAEDSGPYPIFNCSLNLVGGHELAWQQRKATSFVFTPKFCGYDFPDLPPAFCSTRAGAQGNPPAYASSRLPLTVATAMAISGAAASPNMGYHTAPAPAFLMTLFNVRLGWWIGNPRHPKGWLRSSPGWALGRLVAEMFGLTDAEGEYVYLSDGGHFENLGIIELVRRRCRFIIACDAEEDGDFQFSGLGNAIEKCRTDLGVEIELDVKSIRERSEKGYSHTHCAVGRICYDKADPGAHAGTILYLKSSLTGDEPTDVLHYAARNAAFPHESTNDQWFGESQFESYRELGHHATLQTFLRVAEPAEMERLTTERIFTELAQRWYPPSRSLDPAFDRRGETLNTLYETLRSDRQLRFLHQQIYSEWRVLVEGLEKGPAQPAASPDPWLPPTYDELRAGFYFCNRLILLMEDVYHDLHLEEEHRHPDNRGWMNLFMHWAWSRMFRTTWTVCAANCGARFQNFCARHLGLHVGRVRLFPAEVAPVRSSGKLPDGSPLTFVEWQILHAFFAEYNDLDENNTQLQLIQILPGKTKETALFQEQTTATRMASGEPAFTVGFTLLHRPKSGPRELIYLRIRDHMRRMGLARRGLDELLGEEAIALNIRQMPDTALQKDDEVSRRLLQDLFRGVEVDQELEKKMRREQPNR